MQLIGKNKKGGRPAFKPTQRMRDQVEIGSAAGLSHTQLAAVLNISRPTLESNFVDKLKNGRARKLLQSLCALDRAQQRGSVAAAKFLVNVFHQGAPGQRVGKKEQKARDAAEALQHSPWRDLIRTPEQANGQDDEHGRI
jgi:hypothetical protein